MLSEFKVTEINPDHMSKAGIKVILSFFTPAVSAKKEKESVRQNS